MDRAARLQEGGTVQHAVDLTLPFTRAWHCSVGRSVETQVEPASMLDPYDSRASTILRGSPLPPSQELQVPLSMFHALSSGFVDYGHTEPASLIARTLSRRAASPPRWCSNGIYA